MPIPLLPPWPHGFCLSKSHRNRTVYRRNANRDLKSHLPGAFMSPMEGMLALMLLYSRLLLRFSILVINSLLIKIKKPRENRQLDVENVQEVYDSIQRQINESHYYTNSINIIETSQLIRVGKCWPITT